MEKPQPTPERLARRKARRAALEQLAASVRRLIDATVTTDAEPEQIRAVETDLATIVDRLEARRHPGVYSGLLGPNGVDRTQPMRSVPLSPWAGRFNPIAPPVEIRFEGSEVFGRVTLGKAYIGPPATAHGGVVAGIMDQLLASAGQSAGVAGVTATLTVRFRRPTPLHTPLELHAWADPRDEGAARRKVHAEILCDGVVTAEAEAVVIRSARLTGAARGRPRRGAPEPPPS